jgi:hypothetical protein
LEIEGKLDEVMGIKGELEMEVGRLGERLGRVQEELDGERLKVPSPGGAAGSGASRAGAGASELSKQFRGVMKEERKKFQEEMRVSLFLSFFLFICVPPMPCGGILEVGARKLTMFTGGTSETAEA